MRKIINFDYDMICNGTYKVTKNGVYYVEYVVRRALHNPYGFFNEYNKRKPIPLRNDANSINNCERTVAEVLKNAFGSTKLKNDPSYTIINGYLDVDFHSRPLQYDVAYPNLGLAVEYNGHNHSQNSMKLKDYAKNRHAYNNGHLLLNVNANEKKNTIPSITITMAQQLADFELGYLNHVYPNQIHSYEHMSLGMCSPIFQQAYLNNKRLVLYLATKNKRYAAKNRVHGALKPRHSATEAMREASFIRRRFRDDIDDKDGGEFHQLIDSEDMYTVYDNYCTHLFPLLDITNKDPKFRLMLSQFYFCAMTFESNITARTIDNVKLKGDLVLRPELV